MCDIPCITYDVSCCVYHGIYSIQPKSVQVKCWCELHLSIGDTFGRHVCVSLIKQVESVSTDTKRRTIFGAIQGFNSVLVVLHWARPLLEPCRKLSQNNTMLSIRGDTASTLFALSMWQRLYPHHNPTSDDSLLVALKSHVVCHTVCVGLAKIKIKKRLNANWRSSEQEAHFRTKT